MEIHFLKYIHEMLCGNDGKVSSGKVMKWVAFFIATFVLITLHIIFAINNVNIDLTGLIGMLLGLAFGQELAQKITNAVQGGK